MNDVPEVNNNQVFYLMERSDVDTLVTKDVSGDGDPAPIAASDPDPGQELLFDFVFIRYVLQRTGCEFSMMQA